MENSTTQRRISRVLHWVGDITSRSGATALVVVLLIIFGVLLAIAGFPTNWEAGFSTVAGAITLVMLFVVQHTQSRNQLALQLKLDELIRTSPHADDLLVHIEVADDEELMGREQGQLAHHESLREPDDETVQEPDGEPES